MFCSKCFHKDANYKKLITNEDFFYLHKIMGFFSILNFIYSITKTLYQITQYIFELFDIMFVYKFTIEYLYDKQFICVKVRKILHLTTQNILILLYNTFVYNFSND